MAKLITKWETAEAETEAPNGVKRCQAKCRDETACLNRAQKEDYCLLHYKKLVYSS